jgi:hypothetical protein
MPVFHRLLMVGTALVMAVPAVAQTVAPPAADAIRAQVQAFERVLSGAVDLGGQRFAQRAARIVPSVYLAQADNPIVMGFPVPDRGVFVFEVKVPGILQSGVQVFRREQQQADRLPVQTVSSPGRVGADGTVAADPMTETPVIGDPDRAYSTEVRSALLDAMIDNSAVLPLEAEDLLLVVVTPNDPVASNPLYRVSPKKLILSVKGSDLTAFRQGQISREDALHRIQETSF